MIYTSHSFSQSILSSVTIENLLNSVYCHLDLSIEQRVLSELGKVVLKGHTESLLLLLLPFMFLLMLLLPTSLLVLSLDFQDGVNVAK